MHENKCCCENNTHFDANQGHPYGLIADSVVEVATTYGKLRVCLDCADTCHKGSEIIPESAFCPHCHHVETMDPNWHARDNVRCQRCRFSGQFRLITQAPGVCVRGR